MATRDRRHYRVLGLPPTASRSEVREAYRRLAKKWHPDRNPDHPEAGRRFREVNAAYRALTGDPSDQERSTSSTDPGSTNRGDPEFFWRDGLDMICDLPVAIPEAMLGFRLEMPTARGPRVRVRVPPGTEDGTTLRVSGHGLVDGDQRGDHLARLHLAYPARPGPAAERPNWTVDAVGEQWPEDVRVIGLAVGEDRDGWVPEAARGLVDRFSDLHRPALLANLHPGGADLDRLFGVGTRDGFREVIRGQTSLEAIALSPSGQSFAYLPFGGEGGGSSWSGGHEAAERRVAKRLLHHGGVRTVVEGIRKKEGVLLLYLPAGTGMVAARSGLLDGWIGLATSPTELLTWPEDRAVGHAASLSTSARARSGSPRARDRPLRRRLGSSSRRGDGRKEFLIRAGLVVAGVSLSVLAGWFLA